VEAAFALALTIIIVIPTTIFVFVCICLTVRKSGNPWWSQLIPFYSTYVLFKMGKRPILFWIYLPFQILSSMLKSLVSSNGDSNDFTRFLTSFYAPVIQKIYGLFGDDAAGWLPAVAAVISIFVLVLYADLCISIAKAFGKGAGFGIGLLILPFICWAILAFDSSVQYPREYVPTYEEKYYTAE